MIKKISFYFLVTLIFLNSLGCAPILIGAAIGGVSVYAVSKDTIQGDTDKSYDSLWKAAITVSRIRGTIKQEDYNRGYIETQTESSKVWIRLIRLTHATTRIRISSRKYHFPNLDLAQDIFAKILEQAK